MSYFTWLFSKHVIDDFSFQSLTSGPLCWCDSFVYLFIMQSTDCGQQK